MLGKLVPTVLDTTQKVGINTLFDHFQGQRGCFMTFHRVATPDQWKKHPNRAFYLSTDYLREIISYLKKKRWKIVSVSEALHLQAEGYHKYVNFSIDDVYLDTHDLAVPLFIEHKIPVTLYVTTGIPDGKISMWQAVLESVIFAEQKIIVPGDPTPVDISDIDKKIELYKKLEHEWEHKNPSRLVSFMCNLNEFHEQHVRKLSAITWDMLRTLSTSEYVEIGGHTVSHPHLSYLTPSDAYYEIRECKAKLEKELNLQVQHFAFPYGRSVDCGSREFEIVKDVGYKSSSTTTKGVIKSGVVDFYSLPRNTINGENATIAQIEAHLTGVSGLLTRITRSG